MRQVVQQSWCADGVRDKALREQLRDMHALCVLLHGLISDLLKQVCALPCALPC